MGATQKREEDPEGEMSGEAKGNAEDAKYRGWTAVPYIIGTECFQKLGIRGMSSGFLVYLMTVFHLSNGQATTLINVWNGSTNVATIAAAALSDTYFGRYATIGFSSVFCLLGLTVIALTAAVRVLHPTPCVGDGGAAAYDGPNTVQLAFLLSGMVLFAMGDGGFEACNITFGADQFNPRTASGRRDLNSFFNLFYASSFASFVVAAIVIVYVQNTISWSLGLAIPAVLMLLSCVLFFAGSFKYVKVAPENNPFTEIARVLVAAVRKRHERLPDGRSAALYIPPHPGAFDATGPSRHQFRFLDKAAIIISKDELDAEGLSPVDPWRLCNLRRVEEVKCLLRALPVCWAGAVFVVVGTQQTTLTTLQALQCDCRLPVIPVAFPAASFFVIPWITVVVWIPFYDRVGGPWLRRWTGLEGGLTQLQRIGTGIPISIASAVIAAAVERHRREVGRESPMSGFLLFPQLVVLGLAGAFAIISQMEFYYKEFPANMRGIGISFSSLAMALGNYLGGFLVAAVQRVTGTGDGGWLTDDLDRGHLDRFYLFIAGLEVVNFLYFLFIARWFAGRESRTTSAQEGVPEEAVPLME